MLKALMLRRRIDLKKKDLDALREKLDGFATRESELTQAIDEDGTDMSDQIEDYFGTFTITVNGDGTALAEMTDGDYSNSVDLVYDNHFMTGEGDAVFYAYQDGKLILFDDGDAQMIFTRG